MTFLGVTVGQIGTAFEVRTRCASLPSVGVFSNRYLLWAIAGELAIAAVSVFARVSSGARHRRPTRTRHAAAHPSPFIVWGADERRKSAIRARSSRRPPAVTPAPAA